jgi:hypothetical protein
LTRLGHMTSAERCCSAVDLVRQRWGRPSWMGWRRRDSDSTGLERIFTKGGFDLLAGESDPVA